MLLMTMSLGLASCGSDSDDEPAHASGNSLFGMWQLVDSYIRNVHVDSDPTGVVFNKDNTGYWAHFNDLEDKDSFTYTYDSGTGIVTMKYTSPNGGSESYTIKTLTSTELIWDYNGNTEKFKRYK